MTEENKGSMKSIAWIVKSALNRKGMYSDSNMMRFVTIACEYWSEQINTFLNENIEVAYLDFNGTRIKSLPPDYVDYTKVGININGEVWTLGVNKHLVKPRKESCGLRVDNLGNSASLPNYSYPYVDHYRNGALVSGLMTMGGGLNTAYFNIDTKERLLIIDGHIPKGEVILEYVSNGIKNDGLAMVDHHYIAPIREYVLWQMVEHDRNVDFRTKKDRERQFLEAEAQAKFFVDSKTVSEFLDILHQSYSQGAKR